MAKVNFAERILDHIAVSGCDDVLGKPFFSERWDEKLLTTPTWREFLLSQIGEALTQNPVSIGSLCNIAVPKTRYTFRTVANMSLVDTLKYTSLVFSIGKQIEDSRLSKTIVYSNRYKHRLCSLDRSNYDGFRKQSKILSDSGKYKVKIITDISNYYDRINLHKLENILKQIGCDSSTVGKINRILLQWSQQQSSGVPVGSDASRLLAEAMLINADKELSAHRVKFVRYVDDYRIFCSSHERAYEAMQLLDSALRREGLFLNSGKTKLIDLAHDTEEIPEGKSEFEPIDLDEKVESHRLVAGRYASRIAKYYRFPGLEAAKKLKEIDLSRYLGEISDPSTPEDQLKTYVKACIYADTVEFTWLEKVLDIYPHLIPYIVDAIVKEHERDAARLDSRFLKQAAAKFKSIFRVYGRNDYFRIQACRLLCEIDARAGEFLSKEILKLDAGCDVVVSQAIYFLSDRCPRAQFLDLISRYANYGPFTKTSISLILSRGLVLEFEERRAQMKNLWGPELDPFLRRILKG